MRSDSLPPSTLTPLQRDVLEAFFRREQRFFLTGGGALAGFYLGHRETHDLDLFSTEDALEDGEAALAAIARDLGATLEAIRTAPDFRRRLLKRGSEAVLVDLVRERAPQAVPEKLVFGVVRVDPPFEILANKLCALLSRGEIRDLVDTKALEETGLSLEEALGAGHGKDGGLTPAQLSWVLSQITIGEDARPPGGVSPADLRLYLESLTARLAALSFPRD